MDQKVFLFIMAENNWCVKRLNLTKSHIEPVSDPSNEFKVASTGFIQVYLLCLEMFALENLSDKSIHTDKRCYNLYFHKNTCIHHYVQQFHLLYILAA